MRVDSGGIHNMCRILVFQGSCPRCGDSHTWDDLSQRLACLQSKNAGAFGQCQRGVFVEQHGFDQECDRCVEEDEGLGDVGEEIASEPVKRKSDEEAEDQRKKQRV
ncbi:hypothetical protein E4U59_004059 [Claviceps monticola]|nr:hypothetical protein E4U59_004059 [Claviceps monticola]